MTFSFRLSAQYSFKCICVFKFCIEHLKESLPISVQHLQDSCKALEPPTVQKWQYPANFTLADQDINICEKHNPIKEKSAENNK